MIRLSVPLHQALARLSLPALIAAGFGLMLLGKADALLAERARMALADALAPAWGALRQPVLALQGALGEAAGLLSLRTENARLREENERLRHWQDAAASLAAENALLRRQLGVLPEAAPGFVTARVVADGGGAYARAVLLSTGPGQPVRKGAVAMDARGLAGRVTEVGSRSARVVLLTDLNSRIPVLLEGSRARAMLVGTNTARPRLQYWPSGSEPQEGERVVTSAEANAFPAGLPVGLVRRTASGAAEVELFARLDRLDLLRLFDYRLPGILP
ncbi:rod shape-determining protein MreC [Roseicella frigidaeris]|uniref:Cell shape-determining protein MreC n=1 Tax=Roseicella frigidaeris TaxID=2230885 RepID=A0A327MCF6_9PROT|nr:rod shape-determining protein MreC [Roseicella frigidaeris]RAI59854.1 rod shape-determining protein MreC [Roseicella frigidaeris]